MGAHKLVEENPFWFYKPINTGEIPEDRIEWVKKDFPDLLIKTFGRAVEIPNPDSQLSVHLDPSSSLLVMGGNQSGKSASTTVETIITMTGMIPFSLEDNYPRNKILASPGAEGRVICASDQVLKNVVLRNFKKWVPKEALVDGDWHKSYDRVGRCLTLKTIGGGEVYLEFWTYNQRVDTHQGASLVMLLFDEIPPYDIFDENQARLLAAKNYRIIFAATPTRTDASWLHSFILREREEIGLEVATYKLSTIHNPRTNVRVIGQMIKTAKSLDKAKMRLFGDFVSASGFVYADIFRREVNLIEPFELSDDYIVVRGIDPHLSKATVALELAIDRDHTVFVCGMYAARAEINQIKQDLALRAAERKYRLYTSIIDQSSNYKSAMYGKNPYHEFRKPPNAIPLLGLSRKGTDVVEGDIRRIRDYLLGRRLYIFNSPELQPLVHALETIERGYDRRTHRQEQLLETHYDAHACLRYAFQSSLRYVEPKENSDGSIYATPNYYV